MTDFMIKPRMDPQVVDMIRSLDGAEGDGEMDAMNGERGDPDPADASAALDPPDVLGDDEEAEPEQELPELDEIDAFDPLFMAPGPTAHVEDMVMIWSKLC
jgi:hypothetical protein